MSGDALSVSSTLFTGEGPLCLHSPLDSSHCPFCRGRRHNRRELDVLLDLAVGGGIGEEGTSVVSPFLWINRARLWSSSLH